MEEKFVYQNSQTRSASFPVPQSRLHRHHQVCRDFAEENHQLRERFHVVPF